MASDDGVMSAKEYRSEVVYSVYGRVAAAISDPLDPDAYDNLVESIREAQATVPGNKYDALRKWLTRIRFHLAVRDAESGVTLRKDGNHD